MSYSLGAVVKVREYGGRELIRRVVADLGNRVVVCSEREFEDAERQKREPCGVGFPREDVALTVKPSPR